MRQRVLPLPQESLVRTPVVEFAHEERQLVVPHGPQQRRQPELVYQLERWVLQPPKREWKQRGDPRVLMLMSV